MTQAFEFARKRHETVRHYGFYSQNITNNFVSLRNHSSGSFRRRQEIKDEEQQG
jgi:hypothetical protein